MDFNGTVNEDDTWSSSIIDMKIHNFKNVSIQIETNGAFTFSIHHGIIRDKMVKIFENEYNGIAQIYYTPVAQYFFLKVKNDKGDILELKVTTRQNNDNIIIAATNGVVSIANNTVIIKEIHTRVNRCVVKIIQRFHQ